MDALEYTFEYATVRLIQGSLRKEKGPLGLHRQILQVRTTFYVVDEGEVVRTTQTQDLDAEKWGEDWPDLERVMARTFFASEALLSQVALLGQEGWEVVDFRLDVDDQVAQALLKRRVPVPLPSGFRPA